MCRNAKKFIYNSIILVQYGTTPLIWAARKGHHDIVFQLLNAGAVIDKAGMVRFQFLLSYFLLFNSR